MTNEAEKLVKVQERIGTLNSELAGLRKEESDLVKQLGELKKPKNPAIEDIIKERISRLEELGCECTFEYHKFSSCYKVVAKHNGRSTEFTYQKYAKDEFVKEGFAKYTNAILLYNYIESQDIANKLMVDLFYVDRYSDSNIYVYMQWNDSDKFVRMRLTDENTVSVEIIETVLKMPKYKLDLGNGIVFIQEEVDDECGQLIKEYPFTLKVEDTIELTNLQEFLSSKLKAFKTVRNKKFKKLV